MQSIFSLENISTTMMIAVGRVKNRRSNEHLVEDQSTQIHFIKNEFFIRILNQHTCYMYSHFTTVHLKNIFPNCFLYTLLTLTLHTHFNFDCTFLFLQVTCLLYHCAGIRIQEPEEVLCADNTVIE